MNAPARTKIFKSGNSSAVRLPKDLGFPIGTEVEVVKDADGVHLRPVKRSIDVSKFWGVSPGLTVPVREDFDDPPRKWESTDGSEQA